MYRQVFLVSCFFTILLTACGGGGGGGSTGLQYVGNTDPAEITEANATRLLGYVLAGSTLGDEIPTGIVIDAGDGRLPGALQLARRLDRLFSQRVPESARWDGAFLLGVTIDETEPCFPTGSATPSGSIRISGRLSDTDATGSVTITFSNCTDGDTFIDGTVIWRIDETFFSADDFTPVDMTFTFETLTLISPELDIQLGGTLRTQTDFIASTSTFDVVYRDRVTGRMQMTDDLVIVSELAGPPISETLSGRLYDSIDGYITIATIQSLIYEAIDSLYPSSGVLRLTGAANARLRATVLPDSLVSIALDLNDDGSFEIDGDIPFDVIAVAGGDPDDLDGDGLPDAWEAQYGFSNASFADASLDTDGDDLTSYDEFLLGTDPTDEDSDGDGMQDGWEVDFGFDPLDPSDAALDSDDDLATNLDEFTHGTDPKDAFSTPADLAVSKTVSLDTVSAQTLFEYRITVSNLGPGRAREVELSDTLPEGASFHGVIEGHLSAPWDCNAIGDTLTCVTFPAATFDPGASVTITVPVVAPAAIAEAVNDALITSATLDFNAVNDGATVATAILPAIVGQIDVEFDGVGGVVGLEFPYRHAISPDGGHLYVPAIVDDAVAVFARNADTGALAFVESVSDGVDTPDEPGIPKPDFPKAVAVSPEGNHVYVVTEWVDGAIVVFGRDEDTGTLTFLQRIAGGQGGVTGLASAIAVTVSADGEIVYVAGANDNAVAIFTRNPVSGELTFVEAVIDGIGGVDGIAGAFDVVLSPDDAFLYVAGALSNAIAVFARSPGGVLDYVGKVTDFNPVSLAISSDGAFVYSAGGLSLEHRGVSVFARDGVTGLLTRIATYENGASGIVGLGGMNDLAIAPEGGYLYVTSNPTSGGALGIFARDDVTGLLRFIETLADGAGGVDGLGVPWAVAVSQDSRFIYVTANDAAAGAVSAYSVDLDAER